MKKLKQREVVFIEIADFINHLYSDLSLSKNTIDAYESDLVQYESFLYKVLNIEDVRDILREDILKYIQSLKRKNLSKATISRKIVAIKDFHKYLYKNPMYRLKSNEAELIDTPKADKKLPVVLTVDEIDKMISSINTDDNIGIRNKAMIEVLYAGGFRITELLELKITDIHWKEKYIKISEGKGNKDRLVPIGEMALLALRNYVNNARSELLKDNKTNLVFLSYQGKEISRQYVFKYIKKLALENGITKTISPHTIRHSFATHLLENGVDLRIVQELLGHEDISTTQIYTHIDRSKLKNMYDNVFPLSSVNKDDEKQ